MRAVRVFLVSSPSNKSPDKKEENGIDKWINKLNQINKEHSPIPTYPSAKKEELIFLFSFPGLANE